MDALATNAETFNPELELAVAEEQSRNGTGEPMRTLKWWRAMRAATRATRREREEVAEASARWWKENEAWLAAEQAEEEERAREWEEERALERARTHGLRDAATTIVFAQLGKMAWNYVGIYSFFMLMVLGLDAWMPNILVRGFFFVLEWLGNGIRFGLTHDMVKERFDPIAAWVLTLVACIVANETTVAMFPAFLHGVSRLSVFLYILFDAATIADALGNARVV